MNENISTECYTIETHFTIFAFEQKRKTKRTNTRLEQNHTKAMECCIVDSVLHSLLNYRF